jgi:hypothetical protein
VQEDSNMTSNLEPEEGSFEKNDIPKSIIHGIVIEGSEIWKVQWCKRKDGMIPIPCFVSDFRLRQSDFSEKLVEMKEKFIKMNVC